jgi:exopolysaccharide biosynthesis polyprenyl glycosylphosphotransferase
MHPALSFGVVHHSRSALFLKRVLDVVCASALLLLLSPVLAIAAIASKLDSAGPVLFRQKRCGLNGRIFDVLKLRSMHVDAEMRRAELVALNEMDGPVFKIRNDPRVTRVGRWLRRLSVDELPQLWNVVRGEMSLVGPRPPIPGEVDEYDVAQRRRLSMRPGITCLWQVEGRNTIGFTEWVQLDLDYIDRWSLLLDFTILLRTLPAVVKGTGAS